MDCIGQAVTPGMFFGDDSYHPQDSDEEISIIEKIQQQTNAAAVPCNRVGNLAANS